MHVRYDLFLQTSKAAPEPSEIHAVLLIKMEKAKPKKTLAYQLR
jgi:hypothetical protein